MKIKIKIKSEDDLKIIKSNSRLLAPPKQVHKSKKAYNRQTKHRQKDFTI